MTRNMEYKKIAEEKFLMTVFATSPLKQESRDIL